MTSTINKQKQNINLQLCKLVIKNASGSYEFFAHAPFLNSKLIAHMLAWHCQVFVLKTKSHSSPKKYRNQRTLSERKNKSHSEMSL